MKINYFNFKKINNRYLITNDFGKYYFLNETDFKQLVEGTLSTESQVYKDLIERFFIYDGYDQIFAAETGPVLRHYKNYVFTPPSLHIFVVTKNCNQKCVYCQASTKQDKSYNMDEETARRAVDIALQSPSQFLTFEFQGGEPLINFPIIRYIIEYAENKKKGKNIRYTIVSNLTYLNNEIMEYVLEHGIMLSTSLDGNESVHNRNRPIPGENALEVLMCKIEAAKKKGIEISAIQTTTKDSLEHGKEIVDQYLQAGMKTIFIRPLTPLGYAKDRWDKIGYTEKEFLRFYERSFQYIIDCNRQGQSIAEGHASIFLSKILKQKSMNYMELRSPCGGGIGQIAYYYNGDIYTCDEARMLSERGDYSFRIGNVYESDFKEIMENPVCKMTGISSCLEGMSMCSDCVYQPYCGICPVVNWAEYGTVYPQMSSNYRCRIYKGIQDILFNIIETEDDEVMRILENMAK